MNPDGTLSPDDATRAVEAATGAIGAIRQLFPGLSQSSLDKAESKATKRLLEDVKLIKNRGAEIGLSEETIREFADDAYRRHGRRERFEKAVSFASELTEEPEAVANLDQEWAEYYRVHAENAFEETAQALWGGHLGWRDQQPWNILNTDNVNSSGHGR